MVHINNEFSFSLKDNIWLVVDSTSKIVNQFQHKSEFDSAEFSYYNENLYIMYKYTDYPEPPSFRVINGYYLVDKTGEILTKKNYLKFYFIEDTELFMLTDENSLSDIIDTKGNIIFSDFIENTVIDEENHNVSCPIAYSHNDIAEQEAIANGDIDVEDCIHFLEKSELLKMQEDFYKNSK